MAKRRFSKPPLQIGFAPKMFVRTQKVKLDSVADTPIIPLPGMNKPETMIAYALNDLKIRYVAQRGFEGNVLLGGARADFDLPDYGIVILYQGPFHGTTEGAARDVIVNTTYERAGKRVLPVYERDLKRIKPRLLEMIGRPIYT
jgi:hypothetical protein